MNEILKQNKTAFYVFDVKTKEEVEKVNQADSLIFQTEKQLTEFGDKISKSASGVKKNKSCSSSQEIKAKDKADTANIFLSIFFIIFNFY